MGVMWSPLTEMIFYSVASLTFLILVRLGSLFSHLTQVELIITGTRFCLTDLPARADGNLDRRIKALLIPKLPRIHHGYQP